MRQKNAPNRLPVSLAFLTDRVTAEVAEAIPRIGLLSGMPGQNKVLTQPVRTPDLVRGPQIKSS